ncbi:MAG TPA: phosphogluconate dehydrogenase C-terminal domain-containing protein [Verrucomicrobiales bacterium]|nr:phosphogluconate dehydrogenase C-terminal domain-containing protein [Verrucomicrobiales bacterium]
MSTIAIIGAGGKMGGRLTANLRNRRHTLLLVEASENGCERVRANGFEVTSRDEALTRADTVILAVPDRALGTVAREILPLLQPGALVITLDPAAAHAGELPSRPDTACFVTHPCHPDVFAHYPTPEERDDFFGGIHARQAIVCALLHGSGQDYAKGETLAREFYAPVTRAHRITVEQMAILEPTMAETCGIALIRALREALDEAVRRGVPREAAEDFMFGHIKVELGIAFSRVPFPFSDGANLIAGYGASRIFRDDWKSLFEPGNVLEQVRMIVSSPSSP